MCFGCFRRLKERSELWRWLNFRCLWFELGQPGSQLPLQKQFELLELEKLLSNRPKCLELEKLLSNRPKCQHSSKYKFQVPRTRTTAPVPNTTTTYLLSLPVVQKRARLTITPPHCRPIWHKKQQNTTRPIFKSSSNRAREREIPNNNDS